MYFLQSIFLMKISIITTCFNRRFTIRDCIESVLSQDYPDIEYIVVDGASTDGSLSIINEYKDRISTVISESDTGMYEAINKGLRVARGDVIGLLHSDDFLYSPHTISHIAREIESSQADFVYGDGLFVDAFDPDKVVRNWISGRYTKGKVRRGWLPLHPTCYIRREVIEKWGMYDESYRIAADSEFLVRYLYEADLGVHYIREYVVRMRMGGLSTDPAKMKVKWSEDLRMYRQHGFPAYWALCCKIVSKIPQFISARMK